MPARRPPTVTLETLRRIEESPRPRLLAREIREQLEAERRAYQATLLPVEARQRGAHLLANDRVPCRMGGMLLVKTCLLIRSRTWPSGRRKGQPVQRACIGCPLGVEYAKRLPGFPLPSASQPAEVLSPEQRAAKARANGTAWSERVELDPVAEAATLTPDDAGFDHAE